MEDSNDEDELWKEPVTDTTLQKRETDIERDQVGDSHLPHRRTIIHIDVDCFYAQVEMIRNPVLRDKPLGIQQKNIVVTCNYVAREFGVTKLMYIKDAKEKCPQLVLVSGEDLTNYRNVSNRISERLGMDENYLDVTDLVKLKKDNLPSTVAGHVFGDSTQHKSGMCTCGCYERILLGSHLAAEIRAALHKEIGITCCAGISYNKLLAKLVGEQHKPNQQTTLFPSSVPAFMAKLPKARNIPGVGHATARKLADFGVVTMVDLQQCSLEDLKREIGDSLAVTIKELSEGIDENPVIPYSKPQTLSDEDSFKSCCSVKEVHQKLRDLIKSLMIRLVEDGRLAGTVRLTIRRLSAENKYMNRESKQCNIPSHIITKLSKDNQQQICDKMEDILMSLFNKLVDVRKPFHLTLMNVAFCNLMERSKNSISHFFSPPKNQNLHTTIDKHCRSNSRSNSTSEVGGESESITPSSMHEKSNNNLASTLLSSPKNSFVSTFEENDAKNLSVIKPCSTMVNRGDSVHHPLNKRKPSSPSSGFFKKRVKTTHESKDCVNLDEQSYIDSEIFNQLPAEIQQEILEAKSSAPVISATSVVQTTDSDFRSEVCYESSVKDSQKVQQPPPKAKSDDFVQCKQGSLNKCETPLTKSVTTAIVPAGLDREVFLNLPPDIQKELIQEQERKADWAHVSQGKNGVKTSCNKDSQPSKSGNLLKYFHKSK
uniref:DNA polymerase iota-like isoform X2 n=1 Tax=Crassostrea virginica TaxID=6565 RepID=A0A8B8DM95_CRAVI|nr:DNA polymerase iota-like isoform X2 [Crassostrea virginica]